MRFLFGETMAEILKKILTDFWYEKLEGTITKNKDWEKFLGEEREKTLPSLENTFVALNNIKHNEVQVVIFGQDPYPREQSAIGYAFWDGAVKSWDDALSPSIRNIFKSVLVSKNYVESTAKIAEIRKVVKKENILGPDDFFKNSIKQGVLWLNASLTFTSVDKKDLERHLKFWKPIIEKIIEVLVNENEKLVFIFWGSKAKDFQKIIQNAKGKAKYEFVENCHPMLDTFQEKNTFKDIEAAQTKLGQTIVNWLNK